GIRERPGPSAGFGPFDHTDPAARSVIPDPGQVSAVSVPFVVAMLALLMAAAWRDIATRTILDTVSLLLVAAGGLARILEGPSALALSVGAALLLFVLLLIGFARGLLG